MYRKIRDDLEKLEQLERRKLLQDKKKQQENKQLNERRKFIVGKIFLDAFPEYLQLMPQKDSEDNEREFAPLKNFLTALAREKRLLLVLKENAANLQQTAATEKGKSNIAS